MLKIHILLLVASAIDINARTTEVVNTDKGPVQGEIFKTIRKSIAFSSFRGIRYARAPIGELRFKPPMEAEPWQDVFQATQEAVPCPQMDYIHPEIFVGDEDCLNLNIYTPKTNYSNGDFSLLPVMVWIYGGAFETGYTNMSLYGPDFLLEKGVVVVAMNYRLGVLGFLSLNLPNLTGNAGLKDQVLALKWIQKNIELFGGDPNQVTIFGQSAGAVAVDFHVLSDASKGLFHRSISMSGSPLCEWAFSTSMQTKFRNQQLGTYLKINSTTDEDFFAQLMTKSPKELVLATEKLPSFDPRFKPTLENPKIAGDSAFITECTLRRYESGKFQRLPHMTGFMADEAYRYINDIAGMMSEARKQLSMDESLRAGANLIPSFFQQLLNQINNTVDATLIDIENYIEKITTEAFFTLGIQMKLDYMEKFAVPLFVYNISFNPTESMHHYVHNIRKNRAMHSDDLPYIWHVDVYKFPQDPKNPFAMMQDTLSRMWTNFAKYSHPTPLSGNSILRPNIIWPRYELSNHYLNINRDFTAVRNSLDLQTFLRKKMYDVLVRYIFNECL